MTTSYKQLETKKAAPPIGSSLSRFSGSSRKGLAPHQSPGEPGAANKKRASSISTCNTSKEAKGTDNAYASRQLAGSRQGS
jgi:hypothetical protein